MSSNIQSVKLYTKIPSQDWVTINKRVSIILSSAWNNEYYKPIRVLPQYNQLFAVSQKWKSTTFDQLIQFSGEMDQVAARFLALLEKICPNGAWRVSAHQMSEVNSLINQLKSNLTQLSQRANHLQSELNAFSGVQLAADVAHGTEKLNPHWEVLTLASNNAFTTAQVNWDSANLTLQNLLGKLPTIQTQIANAQASTNQGHTIAIEVNLLSELMAEKHNWQDIQHSARSFKAASPAQRHYMDSDNWYYEDVPIDVSKFYQLGNRYSGTAGALDYDPNTEYFPQQGQYMHLQLGPAGNYKSQHWNFIRRVNGWYQIVNGAGLALAYHHEKPYFDYYNEQNANQYWQCVHSDNGWFRLINLEGANNHALGVIKENVTHQIINVHKKKFLFITVGATTQTIGWSHHKLEAITMLTDENDPTQQWCLGASTTSVDHLNNQGYLVSKCLLQDNSGNHMKLALTLEGNQINVTPLNNQSNQKWTTHLYTFYHNGAPYQRVAYVCQGKAIAYNSDNSALVAVNFDPHYQPIGSETHLWVVTGPFDGWSQVVCPSFSLDQVWDIRGGCPHQPTTMVGTWSNNGTSGQQWRSIIT